MIQCDAVRKSYALGKEHVEVLKGLDLNIEGPGYYAIMGASGSGKSTLLHLLGALDSPDAGTITIAGERIDAMSQAKLTAFRRQRIGIVFQQFNLIPTLTAIENVTLPGMLSGEPSTWLKERSGQLLETLEMSHRADHRPDALSGGEQQRIAIARALLFSPALVLADEPTGSLDSTASALLWKLLGQLAREQQTTIVMVTHEPEAASHCQETFIIRDGLISATIETEHLDATSVATRYQQLVS